MTLAAALVTYYGLTTEVAYVTSPSNAFVKSFTYNGQGLPQTMTMATSAGNLTYAYVYDGLGNLVGLIDDNATINGSSNPNYGKEVVTYTTTPGATSSARPTARGTTPRTSIRSGTRRTSTTAGPGCITSTRGSTTPRGDDSYRRM